MIVEGTISKGSARTLAVLGWYWISSNRWWRYTTAPGVTATSLPTAKGRACGEAWSPAPCWASASIASLYRPVARLPPRVCQACCCTCGLSQGTFDGDSASSHWRA